MSVEGCRLVYKVEFNQCNKTVSVMGTTWSSSKNKACCPGLVIATFLMLSSWLLDVMRTYSPGTFVSDILARFSGCTVNWLAWKTMQNLYQILNKIHLPPFTVHFPVSKSSLECTSNPMLFESIFTSFCWRVVACRNFLVTVAEADRIVD